MALDASDFPSEGQNFNNGSILPEVDYLIKNMPSVQRTIGARRPDYVPDMGAIASGKAPEIPPTGANDTTDMPSQDNVPDIPNGMRLPKPKMMPGADTEPGKSISREDVIALERTIMANNAMRMNNQVQLANARRAVQNQNEITYFKDSIGNQYKTVGDKLYVLGWQDSDMKIRLVSDKTNKEVPTNGKKFQIYGWHLVEKVTEKNDIEKVSSIVDVEKSLEQIRFNENKSIAQTVSENAKVVEKPSEKEEVASNERSSKNKRGKRLI